jgi:predicted CoA-substrate-specific enzyme activase
MITLGCDVGSLFTKAVLLRGGELAASAIIETTGTIAAELPGFIEAVLARGQVARAQVEAIAATGRGGSLVGEADFVEEEMACVGVAVRHLMGEVDRVVEIGGQSISAMLLDPDGDLLDFVRNDKCASGSGRFLEVMSGALGIPIGELDAHAARASRDTPLSSQCGVFVESEVITHLNAGEDPADIAAGLCDAVARIIVSQAKRLSERAPYTLTGGVARIQGVVRRVQRRLSGEYRAFPQDPSLAAALGAALLAAE